jgi:glycosyltransferase involved in cell wall biosynthesis
MEPSISGSEALNASTLDRRPADLPLVSAIIPAYNAEKFVHRAIESALAQTHHLLEIIVVDDGSTDETAKAADKYPVTVIRQKNGGPGSARNTGAKAASGEWLAFLDHDDSWHPEKTAQQLQYIAPGIDAVFSEKYPGTQNIGFDEMFERNYGGNPSSTIIRADVLRSLNYFDDDPRLYGLDDYNLWLRFLLAGYRFAGTPNLYDFTPQPDHYGGNTGKMLAAELVNIDKIAALANLSRQTTEKRKRLARLRYLPNLIHERDLAEAREQLKRMSLDRDTAKYHVAFLPAWVLDLVRAARRTGRRTRRTGR